MLDEDKNSPTTEQVIGGYKHTDIGIQAKRIFGSLNIDLIIFMLLPKGKKHLILRCRSKYLRSLNLRTDMLFSLHTTMIIKQFPPASSLRWNLLTT